MRVSVENEWSPLKKVVIGVASPMFWYPPDSILHEGVSVSWLFLLEKVISRLFEGKKVPDWVVYLFKRELKALYNVLTENGVKVSIVAQITPSKGEPSGLTQVFARDPIITIDDKIIVGHQRLPGLRKAKRGYSSILNSLVKHSVKVITIPDNQESIFLEGGDIIIDLPYVYVGVGPLASNTEGAEWLQNNLGPDITVVPVKILKPGIFHLDTCMTLIGPGLGIICQGTLEEPLPHPLNTYDFIEVSNGERDQLAANTLMINPNTIILQKRHYRLKAVLATRGINAISIPFTAHALSGGAFRCATHPLVRASD